VAECTCVGYAGYTLGGGIGPYAGLHGPASDSLLSAEIVTGKGEILTVSSEHHPDLFYGLKGAGFNYGIATSLTYRVHPATNGGQAVVTNMIIPASLNGTIWKTVARFFNMKPTQPKELSLDLMASYDPARGLLFILSFIYAGPEAASTALLKPFLDLNPLDLQIIPTPWEDINKFIWYGIVFEGGCGRNIPFIPYTLNVYKVDVPHLIDIVNYMSDSIAKTPELSSVLFSWAQFSSYGFSRHSDRSSAFPYRDPTVFV